MKGRPTDPLASEAVEPPEPAAEATARVRPAVWWRCTVFCGRLTAFLTLAAAVAVAFAFVAARGDGLRLPQGLEARIVAQLNDAISAAMNPDDQPDAPRGELRLDEISIALPEASFRPEIRLKSLQFRDAVGLRAFFPEVGLLLNGGALLTGEFRLQRVRLDGAGMQLSRDETGAIDLRLAPEAPRQDGGIASTLDAIDGLLATPAFAELEAVSGSDLIFLVNDAVTGRLVQSRDAALRLTRRGDNLSLRVAGSVEAGRDAALELVLRRDTRVGRTEMELSFDTLGAQDLATTSPALGWLSPLEAPISGRLLGEIDDFGRPGDLLAEIAIGAGRLAVGAEDRPITFDSLEAAFRYDASAERLFFDLFDLVSPQLSLSATGQLLPQSGGESYVAQLALDGLRAAPEGVFEHPLEFAGGAIDLRFTPGSELSLDIGQAVLFDGPFDLHLSGSLRAGAAGLNQSLDIHVPEVTSGDVLRFWPAGLAPGTQRYLNDRLEMAQIRDVAIALRRQPGATPMTAVRFDFEEMRLHPVGDLPPIEGGAGYFSVLGKQLVLRLTAGAVAAPSGGEIDVTGSTMVIEEMQPRVSLAEFDLALDGPLPAFGSLLALPPVNLLAESALDPATLVDGRGRVQTELDITLRRNLGREDVAFRASGELSDVRSDSLVPGRVLSAERLDLNLTEEVLSIAGSADLDGVPFTGRWSRVLGPDADGSSRAEGRVTVNEETLEALGVGLPPGSIRGSGGADLTLALLPDQPPALTLTSDLDGIGLAIPSLGWALSEAGTGAFEARLILDEDPAIERLDLEAAGLSLQSALTLAEAGGLERMEIERFRLGGWLDVQGALIGRGAGVAPAIVIGNGRLDLSQVPNLGGSGGDSANAPPITAQLERVALSEEIALTGFAADFAQGMSGGFRGRVNGQTEISGQVVPGQNGPGLDLQTADAGAALRSAGLFDNGYGGGMRLSLRAAPGTGNYTGALDIDGMRVRDAPVMAELLNVVSVVGLIDQLSGEGINMGDIEARFRIVPGAILLDEGSALGPALGISMDGVYDTASGRYDMQGVVSPIYVLNGALGALFAPRREGLIGVSYQVQGQGDRASVTANPLSILTPGIFREIFRRPAPRVEGAAPATQ